MFMFFDTNEIQIQVGVLFNNEKCIVFNSSSPQNYFQDIYSKIYIQKIDPKNNYKNQIQTMRVQVSIFFEFFGSQISIDNIFQDVSRYFLMFFEVSRPLQS